MRDALASTRLLDIEQCTKAYSLIDRNLSERILHCASMMLGGEKAVLKTI